MKKEDLALLLSKTRVSVGITQIEMAKRMNKSIGTIKNWESGYATPDIISTLLWFETLGLNPLRYFLDLIYPDQFDGLSASDQDIEIRNALLLYISSIATNEEVRKLAYCIFGNTGSSWQAQVDMWCAHNHTSMKSRVAAAQVILNNYEMEEAQGQLVMTEHILPNIENYKDAILCGKNSAMQGMNTYFHFD